jgi:hypothetical protein
MFNYHTARLQFGLFLADLNDAIKEGDGERLFKCLKIALLSFYKYNRTKYAYAVLLYICKVTAILSEYDAFHYLHNRFYNHRGQKGSNISLDLRMEQLNLICKTSLRNVGSNFTKNSGERISKSLSFIEEVIETVDSECGNLKREGNHGTTDSKDIIKSVVTDLWDKKFLNSNLVDQDIHHFPTLMPTFWMDLITGTFLHGQKCILKNGKPFTNQFIRTPNNKGEAF